MTIVSNYQWREFLHSHEVPESILQDQFDWIDADSIYAENFLKYKGQYYCLADFMQTPMDYWHGIYTDSVFSGVLIRVSDCGDFYQIATSIQD
jgi:hypothetical protein